MTTPNNIFYIYLGRAPLYGWLGADEVELKAKLSVANTLVMLLFRCNSAINFVLYCISGSRFRDALLSMFGKTKNATPGAAPGAVIADPENQM